MPDSLASAFATLWQMVTLVGCEHARTRRDPDSYDLVRHRHVVIVSAAEKTSAEKTSADKTVRSASQR